MKNNSMMKKVFSLLIVITLLFSMNATTVFSSAESKNRCESKWTLKMEEKTGSGDFKHSVWEVYREPYGSLDRIGLHRLVKANKNSKDKRKVIFMLPGTWQAGGWSKIEDSDINPIYYLADNGYDVYTMEYRTSNIPDMDYDQLIENGVNISTTGDWTYGVFREDVKACVEKIKDLSKVSGIFMSGFSRGATLMYIYANKYQEDLIGLVSLDGAIKDYPEMGTQYNEQIYGLLLTMLESGQLTDPGTGQPYPLIYGPETNNYDSWKLAGVLPYSKNMAGGHLPEGFETITDFVADDAYNMVIGPGLFTNYKEGYIDKYTLVTALNEFARYYPSVQTLEDAQLLAYDDVPYFDYDDETVTLPAIAFLTDLNCFGGQALNSNIPNLTTSEDVTINYLEGYGHMDVLYGTNSLEDVKSPLLEWLNSHMR